MNRKVRGLAVVLIACFVALFVQVNVLQVGQMSCPGPAAPFTSAGCRTNLSNDPTNNRKIVRDFNQPRGTVTTADGVVIAKSVASSNPRDQLKLQRVFPLGTLYGQITGYYNFNFGASGIEREYNDYLAGQTAKQQIKSFSDLFVSRSHVGNLTLTVRNDLQQSASQTLTQRLQQLGLREGAAVVLNPRTGAILAMVGVPTYDPNPLSSHDAKTAQAARDLLQPQTGASPLVSRVYQRAFAPGSTFKVVTGSVGVDSGKVTVDQPSYPAESAYVPPDGSAIGNFGGEVCGGTLITILAESCNSAFATMGAETIGRATMFLGATAFGFNGPAPIDLPDGGLSTFPNEPSKAFLGQNSIGQHGTQATPLQMALVAAGVANDGKVMAPHLLDVVRDDQGDVVKRYDAHVWRQPIKSSSAATMRDAMRAVVNNGTAAGVFNLPGYDVGAKTGTAEIGGGGTGVPPSNNGWMIAWAGPQGQTPTVAVAVVIPNEAGFGNATTGAVVAGPVTNQLLQAALADQARTGH